MNPKEHDDDPHLGEVLAQATESLRQAPISDELIQRCRANALSLDTRTTPRVDSQAG